MLKKQIPVRLGIFAVLLIGSSRIEAQPNSTDPNFPSDFTGSVTSVLVQRDGRIVVVGQQIVRLNSDGSLDQTFVQALGTNVVVSAIARQGDDKLVVAGRFRSDGRSNPNQMVRLLSNGALDVGFSASVDTNGWIRSILTQSDGKILIGGYFREVNGVARSAVARLQEDGSLDETFNLQTNAAWSTLVAIQTDGKVVFDGALIRLDVVVHRLLRAAPDGSIDSSFSSDVNGMVLAGFVEPNGRILVAGAPLVSTDGKDSFSLVRLLPSGAFDLSFSRVPAIEVEVRALAVQTDGRIVVGGRFSALHGVARKNLARLNHDGTIDVKFDPGNAVPATVWSAAIQGDGGVLVGGEGFLIRFLGDGYLQFKRIRFESTGQARLTLLTQVGWDVALEASSDLIHWTTLGTNLSSTTNILEYVDLTAANFSSRFYRAFVP